MAWSLRSTAAAAAAALAFAGAAPALAAETAAPPSHLRAYNLDWLNYIDPQDLPPTRYAVCIVDSGLAVTPDTPPDDPAGPILRRLATDGGSGEPQGTADEQMHGTRMAMAAVAPINDWGTIGTWTGGRVISVRAMVEGETTFRAEAYERGITRCLEAATVHPVAAISLSLGCTGCDYSSEDLAALEERIATAHKFNISVVAAAGNIPTGATQYPATVPGVLAVGAGDASRRACDYATFDERVDILGPACPAESAGPLTGVPVVDEGAGSSTATVVAATTLALLRTGRPDASRAEVEHWLLDTAQRVDGVKALDGAAAARAAGIEQILARASSRYPSVTDSPSNDVVTDLPAGSDVNRQPSRRLRPPKVLRVAWHRGRLNIRVRPTRPDARLEIRLRTLLRDFGGTRTRRTVVRGSRAIIPMRRRPSVVLTRWLPPAPDWKPSRSTITVLPFVS